MNFQYDATERLITEEKDENGTRVATYYRHDAVNNHMRREQD